MRIGILGGTFNPVHCGHIVLAEEVQKVLKLDKVIFVPTKITPLREEREILDSEDRYKMLELALSNYERFEVSRFEIDKGGTSYTVDTIEAFRNEFKEDTQLFFIIGSDISNELDKWRDFDKICKLATFVIAKRSNFPVPKIKYPQGALTEGVITIDIDALDISSSGIRKMIKNNEDYKGLVPNKVYQYILKEGLYK